jgi:hypothetical protein
MVPSIGNQSITSGSEAGVAESIGTGFVEITSLTALIGSSTAEQLTLGNRGAAGLAWAGMSMFGSLSVLKACLAALMPDWLRKTFGLRSATTDTAIGCSLNLASEYAGREDFTRKNLADAVGVVCVRGNQVGIPVQIHCLGVNRFFLRRAAANFFKPTQMTPISYSLNVTSMPSINSHSTRLTP